MEFVIYVMDIQFFLKKVDKNKFIYLEYQNILKVKIILLNFFEMLNIL